MDFDGYSVIGSLDNNSGKEVLWYDRGRYNLIQSQSDDGFLLNQFNFFV